MSGIFISYRRGDTDAWAGRLSDSLKARLGRINVFRDIEDIPAGVESEAYIAREVESCDVLIVLIGPNWLSSQDKTGKRKLDDPKDILRFEIATALKRNIHVVPVLVASTVMPGRDGLPEELKALAGHQAVPLTDTHWSADCQRLADSVRPYAPRTTSWRNLMPYTAVTAVIVLAVGGVIVLFRTVAEHNQGETRTNSKALSSSPVAGAQGGGDGKSNNSHAAPRLFGTWDNGATINVGFPDGATAQKYKVQQVAQEWSQFANLTFKFVDQAREADVRIRFSSGIASWSFRGTEARNIPTQCPTMALSGIGKDNLISPHDRREILHEFGHVLGFLDEIQNPNARIPWRPEAKAAVPYVYNERVTADCRAPLNQPVGYKEQLENYRAFDPNSIMMVPIPSQYLTENLPVGASSELSASDKAFAKNLYPKQGVDH